MTDRYPSLFEFHERMEARGTEPDLRSALRQRSETSVGEVSRLGEAGTVVAFVELLLPAARVPSSVLAAFLDGSFDRQMGRGDEREGALPRSELLPMGFRVLDSAAGGPFGELPQEEQRALMRKAEKGELAGPPGFDSALWFKRARDLVLLGFGSDPRGMVQMGFPGPSYETGYLWLGYGGPDGRNRRRPGHERY